MIDNDHAHSVWHGIQLRFVCSPSFLEPAQSLAANTLSSSWQAELSLARVLIENGPS